MRVRHKQSNIEYQAWCELGDYLFTVNDGIVPGRTSRLPADEFWKLFTLDDGVFKFVRVNNQYRIFPGHLNHNNQIDKNESPQAAGTFFVFADRWRMENPYSTTLNIGTDEQCYADITNILQKPHED